MSRKVFFERRTTDSSECEQKAQAAALLAIRREHARLDRERATAPPAGAAPLAAAAAADIVRAAAASDADAASSSGGGGNRAPTAVILEPTRDLAEQVHECIVQFAEYFREPPLKAALLVGGADAAPQVRALRDGVDVVSGTPGRVLDLVKSGKLRLGEVQ